MSLYFVIQIVCIFHLLTFSSSVLSPYSIPHLSPSSYSQTSTQQKKPPALFLLAFTLVGVSSPNGM